MRQNKFIHYIAILLAAMIYTSCEEDGHLAEGNYDLSLKAHYLSISPNQYNFQATPSGVSNGYVTTMGTSWTFTGLPSWLGVSPSSGDADQEVTFTAQANPSADATRTSIFYLASSGSEWSGKKKVSASQEAAYPYINVKGSDEVRFDGKSNKTFVNVEANCTFDVSYSQSSKNWLQASLGEDKSSVVISVAENNSGYDRSGYVTLSSKKGGAYTTITVYQSSAQLAAETTELNFDNTAATYKLSITSEASWTATVSDSWISVSPTNGAAGTSQAEVSVAPNTGIQSRSGCVYFYIGGKLLVKVNVYQNGIYISLGEESLLDVNSNGEIRKLGVRSNTGWTVTSDSEWLTISPTSGSGDTETTVTIADNPSLSARSGYLTFVSDSRNITQRRQVTQLGKTFSVETTLVTFSDKGGTNAVDVTSDGQWTAQKRGDYDWFDIDPVVGNGTAKLQITAKENLTTEERTGYVDVNMYDKTYPIAVHQDSKYMNVKADALKFTSKGGKSEIEIATNDAWTATIGDAATWLSLDKSEGVGDCKFMVNVSENATVNARKTYVDVVTENAGTTRLNYEQDGRYLDVDQSDFTFFAKGGTSDLATIHTDGVYEITQDGGWFQINKISDNTFTVTATANNTNAERNGSITISLTDLSEGELKVVLPVVQVKAGATFTKGEFTSDKNWNLSEGHDATITVVGFTADKSWNVNPKTSTSLNFTGYQKDGDWNKRHGSSADISAPGYGSDGDWNSNHKDNGDVSGSGYGSDNNWNGNHKDDGNVSGTSYGSDNNWNENHKNNNSISGTGYGSDNNWNKQ